VLSRLCGVVFIGMLIAGITSAQTVRPVSGVVAVSSGTVLIAYTDESGQEIGRSAGIGDPIYLNDEIRTGPDTSLQILLRDQTVFSIGPDAAIVFDEFVYDPANEDQAALSATVTKGVFKFISGKIANNKPEAMKIKLPNATASIRGTTVAGRVRPDGTSDVVLLSGSMSIQADSGAEPVDIFQSGWGTSVSNAGAVAEAFVVPDDLLNDILTIVAVDITAPQPASESASSGEQASNDQNSSDQNSNGQNNQASGPALTPETVETIEDVVLLLTSNVATGDDGNINVENLANYILSSGLADQLNIPPEDLIDDANSSLNIESSLLSFLVAGGQPLWVTISENGGETSFGNPPPSGSADNLIQTMRTLYDDTYSGIVSDTYAGSVTFAKSGLALVQGSIVNTVPVSYDSRGWATFTNSNPGSGQVDYTVVVNHDTAQITGSLAITAIETNSVAFNDYSGTISQTSFTADTLLNNVSLASSSNLSASNGNSGSYTFVGGFGSITDGTQTIDGAIGSFALSMFNDDDLQFIELDNAPAGTRSFINQNGEAINFNSSWTDAGGGVFNGSNVNYDLAQQVVVDSAYLAVDGVFSGDGSTLTYNSVTYDKIVNASGPDYYRNPDDFNDQLYIAQGVKIPALKVEQFQVGSATD